VNLARSPREHHDSLPDTFLVFVRILLEVIVQTVADARAAARGGADRLEVVRAIHDGGLTPDLAVVRQIAAEVSLPLRVMVRENSGYSTDARERPALRRAAAAFAEAGVDGLVLGFAHAGELELDPVAHVLEAAPRVHVTWHRAFDQLRDPLGAIEALAGVAPIDRILTSGGEGTVARRCERLRARQARAGARLTIIAGGGIDFEMLSAIVKTGSIREAHVGRAARKNQDPNGVVSAAAIGRLREIIDQHA
jgi:copper homeostasis protein